MAERDSGQPESVEVSGSPGPEVGATSFLQRAVIRRRVRFLHRRRELALYDLGGFLFESHRLGQPHDEILTEKLDALTALDDELALLQRALGLHEEVAVLSEPGIAACSYCGTLRDSAANFCPGCGRPAAETAPPAAPAATAASEPEDVPVAPEATVEVPAAHLSASRETEIAAAERDEPPAAGAHDAPIVPDATAEMAAVTLPAHDDGDSAGEPSGQHDAQPYRAGPPAPPPAHDDADSSKEPDGQHDAQPYGAGSAAPLPAHDDADSAEELGRQQDKEPAGAAQADDASAGDAPS